MTARAPLGTLPQPTPAQRCAGYSDAQLRLAAVALASRSDAAGVAARTAVQAEIARRGELSADRLRLALAEVGLYTDPAVTVVIGQISDELRRRGLA